MTRPDGREVDQLRDIKITRNFIDTAPGSVLIEWGKTRLIVTATVQEKVPPFLFNTGLGWVSAEYGMLPGSTGNRKMRDGRRGGQIDGRTVEIQRIIGRCLRTVVKQRALGPRTVWVDCDVIQADGGTRTAAITGAWVALYDCLASLREQNIIKKDPLRSGVAAVSVGIVNGKPLLDLCYEEDHNADADFNFVMSHDCDVIEVQGTAEKAPVPRAQFEECYALAESGIKRLMSLQNSSLVRLG